MDKNEPKPAEKQLTETDAEEKANAIIESMTYYGSTKKSRPTLNKVAKTKNYYLLYAVAALILIIIAAISLSFVNNLKEANPNREPETGVINNNSCANYEIRENEYRLNDLQEALVCQIRNYITANHSKPSKSDIEDLARQVYPDFFVYYDIVLNQYSDPNTTDFVVLYGVGCSGQTESFNNIQNDIDDYSANVTVYTPLFTTGPQTGTRSCITFAHDALKL